jgi:hypothetical protein
LCLLQNWDQFAEKVKPIYEKDLKDKNSIELFKKLSETTHKGNELYFLSRYFNKINLFRIFLSKLCPIKCFLLLLLLFFSDSQDCIIAMLLCGLICPTDRYTVITKGIKKQYKPTIINAQQSFVLLVENASDFGVKIQHCRDHYQVYGFKMQPMIFVVGKDVTQIEFSYVIFDGVYYKFDKFIDALDLCYKIFWVFGLHYQKECILNWQFIQKYFFGMKSVSEKSSPKINTLIQRLKD